MNRRVLWLAFDSAHRQLTTVRPWAWLALVVAGALGLSAFANPCVAWAAVPTVVGAWFSWHLSRAYHAINPGRSPEEQDFIWIRRCELDRRGTTLAHALYWSAAALASENGPDLRSVADVVRARVGRGGQFDIPAGLVGHYLPILASRGVLAARSDASGTERYSVNGEHGQRVFRLIGDDLDRFGY